MRFGALERLGADYDSITKYNPTIVYAHGSGYGPEGPDANNGSMDILGQARGGMMAADAADGVPRGNVVALADHVGAITMAFGIMSALYHRQRTGEGQKVDSSLLGAQTVHPVLPDHQRRCSTATPSRPPVAPIAPRRTTPPGTPTKAATAAGSASA